MVEPVDVGHRGELDIVETFPRSLPVDEFGFVGAVDGLGERVNALLS